MFFQLSWSTCAEATTKACNWEGIRQLHCCPFAWCTQDDSGWPFVQERQLEDEKGHGLFAVGWQIICLCLLVLQEQSQWGREIEPFALKVCTQRIFAMACLSFFFKKKFIKGKRESTDLPGLPWTPLIYPFLRSVTTLIWVNIHTRKGGLPFFSLSFISPQSCFS